MNLLIESNCDASHNILLVEDNPNDVYLTREVFQDSCDKINMYHVENGVHCMSFLQKQGDYLGVPTPDLILLDLNMPLMDGRAVLARIVQDPALRSIPVVILTTSNSERDRQEMYELRCSSYIAKPVDFVQFTHAIHEICEYWFRVVTLPPT